MTNVTPSEALLLRAADDPDVSAMVSTVYDLFLRRYSTLEISTQLGIDYGTVTAYIAAARELVNRGLQGRLMAAVAEQVEVHARAARAAWETAEDLRFTVRSDGVRVKRGLGPREASAVAKLLDVVYKNEQAIDIMLGTTGGGMPLPLPQAEGSDESPRAVVINMGRDIQRAIADSAQIEALESRAAPRRRRAASAPDISGGGRDAGAGLEESEGQVGAAKVPGVVLRPQSGRQGRVQGA